MHQLVNDLLNRYKLIVLDIDNTIYPEIEYIKLAYKKISEFVAERNYCISENEVYNFLLQEFIQNGRRGVFDKLNEKYFLHNSIDSYLKILRTVKIDKKIELYAWVNYMFKEAEANGNKLAFLTNGNQHQQRNKLLAVDIPEYIRENSFMVFADDFQPKPSAGAMMFILDQFKISSLDTLLIGDDEVDEECALNSGVDFMNVEPLLV